MNNCKINYCLLLILSFLGMSGQSTNETNFLPNITPPSPVAYELGKYGNVPVGMFTGSTNVNIPIYNYKSSNIEVPINLSYTKNGIKVDDNSGNAGLGWSLNMGGVINRTIRDRKDESALMLPNERVLEPGINPEKYEFYQAIGGVNVDSEPDLFSFSFGGYSGQFIFDNDGIMMLKASKIKIEYTNINSQIGFVATTTDGVQYFFFATETSLGSFNGAGHGEPNAAVTSWHLTKIKHPKGDEVYFTYANAEYQYITSKSQTLLVPLSVDNGFCSQPVFYSSSVSLRNIAESSQEIFGKRLTQISTNNNQDGIVTFTYGIVDTDIPGLNKISQILVTNPSGSTIENVSFQYETTANKRTFLNQITYLDPTKKHSFEYIDKSNFPKRLSLSQDIGGYYNGKNNTAVIPSGIEGYGLENLEYGGANRTVDFSFAQKGMLSKIIYPTKGYTVLEYEPNDYFGDQTIYPAVTNTRIAITLPGSGTDHTETIITSPINQRFNITGRSFFNTDCSPNMNTGHAGSAFQVIDLATNQAVNLYTTASNGNPYLIGNSASLTSPTSYIWFGASAGKSYKFMIDSYPMCTRAYCDIKYFATAPTTIQTNIVTGGVRVKKALDYDYDNTVKISKKYYYSISKDDLTHSSGKLVRVKPFYGDIITTRASCNGTGQGQPITYAEKKEWIITSGSIIDMFDYEGSNIHYSNVIESIGGDNFDGGAIEHQYKINRNSPGNLLMGTDIQNCPTRNDGWDNGNELTTVAFSKTTTGLVKINEKKYNYKLDSQISKKTTAFSCRKNFDLILSGDAVYYCQSGDISNVYFDGYNCTAQHQHLHSTLTGKCSAFGNNNVAHYSLDHCYGRNIGDPIYYSRNLENLSIKSYEIKSNWSYLESMEEIQYDINGQNPLQQTINYIYGNTSHLQLTSEMTTTSAGEILEKKNYYPHDLPGEPFSNNFITQNIIDVPLKTEVIKNSAKLSEQKTVYNNWGSSILAPQFIQTSKGTQNLQTRLSYNVVDSTNGNPLEVQQENGIKISYIWGYNKTKPVAKIENAAYTSIPANLITAIETASSPTGSESALITALSNLRNALPNAMVTTYTYIPLVGIRTVTDPKGDTVTYVYDAFNRLKQVKDRDGNILSENEYHYKN